MSKIDHIMLRFRRIAPKPATSGSVAVGSKPGSNAVYVKRGRGKRSSVRDAYNDDKRCRGRGKRSSVRDANNDDKRCYIRKRKASPVEASGGSVSGGETVVTLPLLPETPDQKDSLARGSSSDHFELSRTKKEVENAPIWLNFTNQVSSGVGRVSVGSDRMVVSVVGSIVTVECVTETSVDHRDGMGCTDEEKRWNLEWDTCPGFISDGMNQVGWTNGAYREMVGQDMVWLVMKEGVPVTYRSFTCRARLQYTCGKKKSSQTVPCDAWRMDGGGFAWKLDVNAALCLGR